MEGIAQIFISAVVFANTILPQAQVPQVLGVRIADDSVATQTEVDVNLAKKQRLEEAKTKRLEASNVRQAAKEEAHAKVQTEREAYKSRLVEIKDVRKQNALKRFDANLSNINKRWTTNWSNVLDRLVSILARVQSKLDKLEEAGVDTSSVDELIVTAEADIEAANIAVAQQAAKEYVVQITDDDSLRADANVQKQALRSDLGEVKDKVSLAKSSVRAVVSELKSLIKI